MECEERPKHDLKLKGVITTVNVEGPGPFKICMESCRSKICAVQEHRTLSQHLPALQSHVRDLGYHGFFGGAVQTEADGKSGGVVIVAVYLISGQGMSAANE
ncbi:unnamed protein product, partial [Prorocentrum cordatum]